MNEIAESYVKLALAVGEHDTDYIDAYYGPREWRDEAKAAGLPLESIQESAAHLLVSLRRTQLENQEEILQLRQRYLVKQIEALAARVDMLRGKKLTFDEEARSLYDAAPLEYTEAHFEGLLGGLEDLLPGRGPITERYEVYRRAFTIPSAKLEVVFQTAITECRGRTKEHIDLPANERFDIEYVQNKSWSGYNWYKGDSCSLIQINTDLPISIDRAVDLAAHEGYPGHHVYNALLEKHFVRKRNWVEFSVYPLHSPQSLIAEGTANYGIEVAFPGNERVAFERERLFPIAGLNPTEAERYYEIHRLAVKLNYAHNEAARRYLDGKFNRPQAEKFLVTYALMSPERAQQRVRFIDTYRSYVINYNLGQDLVKSYIESRGGTADRPGKRWEEFTRLISSPRLPSGLVP
jgi:hypothetical protein